MEAEADQSKFIVWNRIFYININIEFYFKKSKFILSNQNLFIKSKFILWNRYLFVPIEIYLLNRRFFKKSIFIYSIETNFFQSKFISWNLSLIYSIKVNFSNQGLPLSNYSILSYLEENWFYCKSMFCGVRTIAPREKLPPS